MKPISYGKAICYSGYRTGQSPHLEIYPTYDEVVQDLQILVRDGYQYIRIYDPSQHAKTVLQVIQDHQLPLQVMLGVDLLGEENNPKCTWGGDYTEQQIIEHKQRNRHQLDQAITLANQYEHIVFAVSAGNESIPEWNENLVLEPTILEYVLYLKDNVQQPVTYCDGCNYWVSHLKEVAKAVDFLSLHSYAAWAGFPIEEAFSVFISDVQSVQRAYHNKPFMITETGWPTQSGGKGIPKQNCNVKNHKQYINQINEWSMDESLIVFLFEAFDEPWKGGQNPNEPEKNWGLYTVDRVLK